MASVRLDRPLLKLRLTPRRRIIIATAPGGGGTPPPMGGGTVTVPLPERQNGTRTNQPIEGGGGLPQPPNGVGGGTDHCSQKGVEECLSNWQVEELHHLVLMGMVDSNGGGGRPPPPRGNGGSDDDGDGAGDDSPPQSDHRQPRHHRG